jgi:hypothetical protein
MESMARQLHFIRLMEKEEGTTQEGELPENLDVEPHIKDIRKKVRALKSDAPLLLQSKSAKKRRDAK